MIVISLVTLWENPGTSIPSSPPSSYVICSYLLYSIIKRYSLNRDRSEDNLFSNYSVRPQSLLTSLRSGVRLVSQSNPGPGHLIFLCLEIVVFLDIRTFMSSGSMDGGSLVSFSRSYTHSLCLTYRKFYSPHLIQMT